MCGGGGGGGGGAVSNNRPSPMVQRTIAPVIDRNPSLSTPERPKLDLNSNDSFTPARNAVRKKATPKPNAIARAVETVKQAVPKIGDFIKDRVGRITNPSGGSVPVEATPEPVPAAPHVVVPR